MIGYYRVSSGGLLGSETQIEMFADSTFKYEFSAGLLGDRVNGKYTVLNDTIYFDYFLVQIDSITHKRIYSDTTGKRVKLKYQLMPNHAEHLRPMILVYKKRKLFVLKKLGQLSIKKEELKGRTSIYYLTRKKGHILND